MHKNTHNMVDSRAATVLAGVLAFPETWERVQEQIGGRLDIGRNRLRHGDDWTRTAFAAMRDIIEQGNTPDVLPLCHRMQELAGQRSDGYIQEWTEEHQERVWLVARESGALAECIKPSKVVDAATDLAASIERCEIALKLSDAALRIQDGGNAADMLHDLMTSAQVTSRRTKIKRNNIAAVTSEYFEDQRNPKLPTGFEAIDEANAGGIDYANVTLACAQTNRGKTMFLLSLCRNQLWPASAKFGSTRNRIADNDDPGRTHILFVSAEQPAREIVQRIVADALDMNMTDLNKQKQRTVDAASVRDGLTPARLVEMMERARLTIVDAEDLGNVDAPTIRDAIDDWSVDVLEEDPDAKLLVLVDYLQHLDLDGSEEGRYRQIEITAKMLKGCAKRHNIALVLACQVNDIEGNPEPGRQHIRDSKSPSNLAANIWMIHTWSGPQREALREAGYADECLRTMTITSDKARSAASGWCAVLAFDGAHARITDAPKGAKNYLRDQEVVDKANRKEPKPSRRRKKDDDDLPNITVGSKLTDWDDQ